MKHVWEWVIYPLIGIAFFVFIIKCDYEEGLKEKEIRELKRKANENRYTNQPR